eukprot:92211_1
MDNYHPNAYNDGFQLAIADNGVLSLQLQSTEQILWSRRTPCEDSNAYFYYSMNLSSSMIYDGTMGLYSLDCSWAMVITRRGPIDFVKDINTETGESGVTAFSIDATIEQITFNSDGIIAISDSNTEIPILSANGGDFMVFDSSKLTIFDHESNTILQQLDFDVAKCTLSESDEIIKYFYYMKPGDILFNGEALISANCEYMLILRNGSLSILNSANTEIWNAGVINGEKFEFHSDGNMVLYSYC